EPGQRRHVALGSIVNVVKTVVRAGDLVCRHGEDDVVVLVPDTSPEAAVRLAGRIETSLREAPEALSAFIRAGLAVAPADGTTLEELVTVARARADQHPCICHPPEPCSDCRDQPGAPAVH
ncbi:MAG: diguanylate cyclase, partial [Acidobacteria bacterium]